ncbi:MAG TPA: ACT domain-containing protein [Syntrophomonadaceae bacterium]|nr:ACT domain-containing protein [Syntrophomonadaceae bacterium]
MVEESQKLIITVIGHDQVGIIASISAILAQSNINILDISQTILQGFFTMVMVVDSANSRIEISELREILSLKGKEMNLVITIQHEDIFKFMHRI